MRRVGFGITYHGENDEGRCVLSAKFKNPKIEEEKNKLIERKFNDNPKEVFRHYQFRGDGVSYNIERITNEGVFKESYHESWNEKDKNRILEKSQHQNYSPQQENSLNFDKKEEKENNRKDFSQKADKQEGTTKKENNLVTNQESSLQNKDNNQNIYYRVGLISLVILVISVATISLRKRKLKKI